MASIDSSIGWGLTPPIASFRRWPTRCAALARDVDLVARLAPGRFGILLPETDEVAAINYVERVRRACELWLESGAIALTLAVGWAGTDGEPTLIDAQRLATERMYVELRRDARKASEG